ncbi:YjhX family toxin [Pleomorphomonas sp. PLEO]|uniref:YjhX family toxin n=1 Tax=Pleomorphomonas sp. PLEO TaxID=3239306 RepID=UPI00351DED3E
MDISRAEQRVLHLLAQGGRIEIVRDERGDIEELACYSRDGWLYTDFGLVLFRKLKHRRAIASRDSKPYRITPRGLELVRSQPDNR